MKELTADELSSVSGGLDQVGWIGLASDAMTIGGGILIGAAYTTSPIGWVAVGVTGAYYGGQMIGSWAADDLF